METWRLSQDGFWECVNERGEVILRQRKDAPSEKTRKSVAIQSAHRKHTTATHHFIRDQFNRKIWVPKGTNPDDIPTVIYPYCQTTRDLILNAITEGHTLKEIAETEGFPPLSVINRWLRAYPEFAGEMKIARKARGEFFADLAIETAANAQEKTVGADRLKVETWKWAAEVNDRETYGKHTKLTGDANAPIAFMIDTGIRREGDQPAPLPENPPIPTEGKPVEAPDGD